MSPDLLSNIVFGIAMFLIGIYALWQAHRGGRQQQGASTTPVPASCFSAHRPSHALILESVIAEDIEMLRTTVSSTPLTRSFCGGELLSTCLTDAVSMAAQPEANNIPQPARPLSEGGG